MEKLEVKTAKANTTRYCVEVDSTTVFLHHPEDKVTAILSDEGVNIEIYHNGEALFLGDKFELFEILRNRSTK